MLRPNSMPLTSLMPPLSDPLLIHPNAQSQVLSIRAKALVFADPLSLALLERIEQVAPSDAAVLVTGETGTGKELVARHLHRKSGRKGPFIAVNCGALSESLAEAELFGHQAGSFTGATEAREGWFEAANGGTLFLDEVGDLPLPLQAKLLRVLQEREVVRLGSRRAIPLDIRVIAGTNVDLPAAIAAKNFRVDLYYRLNVVALQVPTLAERPGDILPLAEHFIRLYSQRLHSGTPVLTPEAERALLTYPWPGNIRELESVIHVALLTAREGLVRPQDLRFAVAPRISSAVEVITDPIEAIGRQLDRLFGEQGTGIFERLEKLIVTRAFEYSRENQVQTARLLDISRNVLRAQLKRFGLIDTTPESATG
jgi:sigma-54 dependent transcriptional regulator